MNSNDFNSQKIITRLGNKHSHNYILNKSAIVQNLLLFQKIFINSDRLWEIEELVKLIGFDLTLELLRSDDIQIDCFASGIGSTNQVETPTEKNVYFKPVVFHIADEEQYLSSAFKNLDNLNNVSGIRTKHIITLKRAILNRLHKPNKNRYSEAAIHAHKDFYFDGNLLRDKISSNTKKILNLETDKSLLRFDISKNKDDLYTIENNLCDILKCNPHQAFKIFEKSFLSIASQYQTLELMHEFKGILPLKDSNQLNLLKWIQAKATSNEANVGSKNLTRILDIAEFPDFRNEDIFKKIEFTKLLDLRKNKDIQSFRDFVFESGDKSDEELKDKINSLKNTLGSLWDNKYCKLLRIGLSSAYLGPMQGAAYSLLETFIFDKVLKKDAAISFISNELPQIFRDNIEE